MTMGFTDEQVRCPPLALTRSSQHVPQQIAAGKGEWSLILEQLVLEEAPRHLDAEACLQRQH
jgi:hypothetical protein